MAKTDGGSAFPHREGAYEQHGMSLRDYFAAAFLKTVRISDGGADGDEVAAHCYRMADAMLKAREA